MKPIRYNPKFISPLEAYVSPLVKAVFFDWFNKGYRHIAIEACKDAGKTNLIAFLLLLMHEMYAGLQSYVIRTEYTTIKNTFYETLTKQTLSDHWSASFQPLKVFGGDNRPQHVDFDNGGRMNFGGLDNSSKTQGLAMDVIFANEFTRFEDPNEFGNAIASSAGGRAGNLIVGGHSRSLLISDMNPTNPYAWHYDYIEKDPHAKLYKFSHKENPTHYDWEQEIWLPHHDHAMEDLLRMYPPGHMRDRMVYGIRAGAEGAVFDNWSRDFEYPMTIGDFSPDTEWFMACDHGGTSPFAIELTGRDGGVYKTFRELSLSNCTFDTVIDACDALLAEYGMTPQHLHLMYCDNNVPAFNKALRERGYPVIEADKKPGTLKGGNDTLKRLIGEGRIHINTYSLQKQCPHFDGLQGWKQEVGSYAYHPKEKQLTLKDADLPIDTHNHWCDAKRYLIHGEEGELMTATPTDLIDVDWTF